MLIRICNHRLIQSQILITQNPLPDVLMQPWKKTFKSGRFRNTENIKGAIQSSTLPDSLDETQRLGDGGD